MQIQWDMGEIVKKLSLFKNMEEIILGGNVSISVTLHHIFLYKPFGYCN